MEDLKSLGWVETQAEAVEKSQPTEDRDALVAEAEALGIKTGKKSVEQLKADINKAKDDNSNNPS